MKNENMNKTTLPVPGAGADLLALAIAFFELDIAVDRVKAKRERLES